MFNQAIILWRYLFLLHNKILRGFNLNNNNNNNNLQKINQLNCNLSIIDHSNNIINWKTKSKIICHSNNLQDKILLYLKFLQMLQIHYISMVIYKKTKRILKYLWYIIINNNFKKKGIPTDATEREVARKIILIFSIYFYNQFNFNNIFFLLW